MIYLNNAGQPNAEMSWQCWEKSCYKFMYNEVMNYTGSKARCKAMAAHLVAIETEQEQLFLMKLREEIPGNKILR